MKKIAEKVRQKFEKLNNSGVTLTELIVTFALLGIFFVAAAGVISYVIGIYYATSGNSYGLQVSTMISNKLVGQIEGASAVMEPVVSGGAISTEIDSISLVDKTGSRITIFASPQTYADGTSEGMYINIHYDAVQEGSSLKYESVDWRFDAKAYMGYIVKGLKFESPGAEYPQNVLKMTLILHSDRYGDYTSTYYIKCVNVERIQFT
ncbi:MAG: prepilin-type N-terminal cleavage/methylation domain-containing protein [bacterium]|nr:prepilin-type N-terminal cleavage/methylation domain-containing protein [bacterium]MDY4101059.1 prepilin-type N-terminal cleavage/methylation domain-containing protein [Lachnospiraceae bacterium]